MASKEIRDIEDQLNDRDKEFCRQLIITEGNAYKSAKNAGFAESTAKCRAFAWVRKTLEESEKPILFKYYQLLLSDSSTAVGISIEGVLNELKSIAFSDITQVVQLNGGLKMTVKSHDKIPDHIKPAISKISKSSYGVTIQFHDKIEALKMLLDYMKTVDDKNKGSIHIDSINFNVKGSQSKLLKNGKRKKDVASTSG